MYVTIIGTGSVGCHNGPSTPPPAQAGRHSGSYEPRARNLQRQQGAALQLPQLKWERNWVAPLRAWFAIREDLQGKPPSMFLTMYLQRFR